VEKNNLHSWHSYAIVLYAKRVWIGVAVICKGGRLRARYCLEFIFVEDCNPKGNIKALIYILYPLIY